MAEIVKELEYRINMLHDDPELNSIKDDLKRNLGDRAIDQDGNIKFDQLPLMDMIMHCIKSSPDDLKELLDYAKVSLDSPAIRDSIISSLSAEGMDDANIKSIMTTAGINVTDDQIDDITGDDKGDEVDEFINIEGALFDDMGMMRTMGELIEVLTGEDQEQGQEQNEGDEVGIKEVAGAAIGLVGAILGKAIEKAKEQVVEVEKGDDLGLPLLQDTDGNFRSPSQNVRDDSQERVI